MTHFEFIASSANELALLRSRRLSLQARKASADFHSKQYRLLTEELKQVEMQLAYKEREVSQFVETNC
ncbi:hypothetical protein [Pontibacter mangrovi]|uniref:Uncharacterized protein n=1 Tax=Pontibacter mangrovi TaxID=2589816 RepID=A0A501W3T9_9BACT|nr:hypothetical protein [Pontibacter mangrovi]TPE43948.1 hypothetical protein FJM65_11020 [Pontibacter mangrovi]